MTVYSHLRLMTLHENHMKKINIKATYILNVNFKPDENEKHCKNFLDF